MANKWLEAYVPCKDCMSWSLTYRARVCDGRDGHTGASLMLIRVNPSNPVGEWFHATVMISPY